jgi:hypothetical protein
LAPFLPLDNATGIAHLPEKGCFLYALIDQDWTKSSQGNEKNKKKISGSRFG